jgi:hypothetical protein
MANAELNTWMADISPLFRHTRNTVRSSIAPFQRNEANALPSAYHRGLRGGSPSALDRRLDDAPTGRATDNLRSLQGGGRNLPGLSPLESLMGQATAIDAARLEVLFN